MKETVYRLRITPNSGKAIFADTTKENYEALLAQAKAEGTFKVYVVRATPKDKPRYSNMMKLQKELHPKWPFLTKHEEDKAFKFLIGTHKHEAPLEFEEIYGFEPGSRDYSILAI